YHLAVKQNLSGSAVPSIANQVGGSHRDQGHGRQAGPLGLPHAALRHEIRGPRSSRLRASTPRVTDQAPQGQSPKARIPSHPNTGGGLTSRSFWREIAKLAARRNSRYLIKRVRFSPGRALFRNFPREARSRSLPLKPCKINKPWTPSITGSEVVAAGDSADLAMQQQPLKPTR